MYSFACPACGTQLTFHKRVTFKQRYCPHCNRPITPQDIDTYERSVQEDIENQRRAERAKEAEEARQFRAGGAERERKEQERLQQLRDEALGRREQWQEEERQQMPLKIIAWVVAALVLLIFFIWIVSRS